MRSASVGWAGVVPHALSKEKMEKKKKTSKRKGKDRETRGDHLRWRWKDGLNERDDDVTDVEQ